MPCTSGARHTRCWSPPRLSPPHRLPARRTHGRGWRTCFPARPPRASASRGAARGPPVHDARRYGVPSSGSSASAFTGKRRSGAWGTSVPARSGASFSACFPDRAVRVFTLATPSAKALFDLAPARSASCEGMKRTRKRGLRSCESHFLAVHGWSWGQCMSVKPQK